MAASQSYGDRVPRALRALKGERIADEAVNGALMGDSKLEKAGDCGIRRRPSQEAERAEEGMTKVDEVGTVETGDLRLSQ